MEVKIKYNIGYVDADWTMENGVMVVSPKIEKYEPTDGEIVTVTTKTGMSYTCFFNRYINGFIYSYGGLNHPFNKFFDCDFVCCSKQLKTIYPATEEEKKKLFDKLKEEGYEWKAETKELIKLKWQPKEGEEFWFPLYYTSPFDFKPLKSLLDKGRDKAILAKGWCFKTREECKEFCNRLNDVINSLKP